MRYTLTAPQPAALLERNGDIQFRVVNNDGDRESTVVLAGLTNLFHRQLPEMDKTYVARVVYDPAHLSLAMVKMPLKVIGGIVWREFRQRKFAEIIFCAISADDQVKGYGSHIMAHAKDYVRATSPITHLLTYADNNATGYFKKQGFTEEIALDKSMWGGCIKDYIGATLMECALLPRIRYLVADRMLHKQNEAVQKKIRASNKNHIIHQPPLQWANGHITPIDPLSIPAIRATGWSPSPQMSSLAHTPYLNKLRRFLGLIKDHRDAWPFLEPVDPTVPMYYELIALPMDLGTVEVNLEDGSYPDPKGVVFDLELMFENCLYFNEPSSVYCKCANGLRKYMWRLIEENPEWSFLLPGV